MGNLNKVFLMGNLTRDPELRHTPNGSAVTDLGVAINRYYVTKDGDRREECTFIDVTVWNRTAENCCQYLRKGRPVHIEGYLKMDSWDDKTTGEKRTKLKVEAERVQFIGGRQDGPGGGAGGGEGEDDDYAPSPAPRRDRESSPPRGRGGPDNGAPTSARRPTPPPPPEMEGDEDDIPF